MLGFTTNERASRGNRIVALKSFSQSSKRGPTSKQVRLTGYKNGGRHYTEATLRKVDNRGRRDKTAYIQSRYLVGGAAVAYGGYKLNQRRKTNKLEEGFHDSIRHHTM